MDNIQNFYIEYGNGQKLTFKDMLKGLKSEADLLGIDLNDCNSTQFSVCLYGIGKLFNDTKALYNNLAVDKELLLQLSDVYIYLCSVYNKRICMLHYLHMLNLNDKYIYTIHYRHSDYDISLNNSLNSISEYLIKKFDEADNILQMNNARDSKVPIMNIAYNNYKHNWSGTIKSNEINTTAKSLADIKRTLVADNNENIAINSD